MIEEMERKFFELKGKLEVGVVSEEEFKAQVQKLRFQDKQGRWWMLGAQSGRWYMYDGARWIPGYPPRDAVETAEPTTTGARETAPTAEAREAAPSVAPAEAREAVPSVAPTAEAREAAPTVAPTTEAREAMPSVAPTAEAREAAPSVAPTEAREAAPSVAPAEAREAAPSVVPTEAREAAPSVAPTEAREAAPSVAPTAETREAAPSVAPTEAREAAPSVAPTEAREAAPSVAPTEAREAAPSVAPTEAREETPATTLPPSLPPLPERLTTETRAPRELFPPHPLPVSGPVLIAGAAFIALLGVIVFWIILDNVVPNHPISRFFAGLLGASPTPTPTLVTGPNIVPILAQGDQLLLRSHIDVAIVQYQNAAQLAPTSAEPLVRWSRALAFKGLMADSLAKAQLALQRAPNDVEVHAQLCRAYAWNGQIDDAVRACERAMQLDLQNVNARANLAEAYLRAQRMGEAQASANAALQLAPASAEAHRAQAWVYTIQGQRENALKEWQQTIALEPNFYFRHFEYGEVLRLHFNLPDEAVGEHQKAVTLYGAYVPAISRLGLSLLAANKPQEAISHLRRALTLDATSDAYANLGLAFGMANQCSQAIPYFEEALRMDPNNAIAQRGLTDCRAGKTPTLPPPQPLQVPFTPPIVTTK